MKSILKIGGIFLLLLLVAAAALPFLIDANQFRPRLEAELSTALGRPVKVGNVKLALLSGGVSAADLSISDDPNFTKTAFLTAQQVAVSVEIVPLILSRKLTVTGITIEHPSITLLQNPSGDWNFSSLGGHPGPTAPATESASIHSESGANLDLTVRLLKITDGRLVLGKIQSKSKPEVFDKVNIQVQDFSASSVFPFELTATATAGAQIQLKGKAGPISQADTIATPVEASLAVSHLDLAGSGFLPATGFAGLVSINATVNSSGKKAAIKGGIKADQLVLAKGGSPAKKQVGFDFALAHDMVQHAGQLSSGVIHIGAATASLTGTYHTQGDDTHLAVKLAATSMPIPELEAMLPALNVVLPSGSSLQGGSAHANIGVAGPTDRLVLDGSLGLEKTRLAGFDLGSKMQLVTKLAGLKDGANTDIQELSATVHVDPSGVRSEAITVIVPEIGELRGAGTVSPEHALDFAMTAKVHTGGVLAAIGPEQTVPFKIQGTSAQPKFVPDVKGIAANQLKTLPSSDLGKAATGLIKGLFNKNKNQGQQD